MVPVYYLATALPVLGGPGSDPPLTLPELAGRVVGGRGGSLIRVVLLGEDLIERSAFLAAGGTEPRPAVLTAAQAKGRDPLPPWLRSDPEPEQRGFPDDGLRAAFWAHAATVARRRRSAFLLAWIHEEVGLRNALAAARSRARGVAAARYLVLPDLGWPAERYDAVVTAWSAAATPLAGLQVLLRARWSWLGEHDGWFAFTDDELAAYAVRLTLLHRWRRVLPADGFARSREGEGRAS